MPPNETPTASDYDEILKFRSMLCADGYQPIKQWKGGEQTDSGGITFPWPEYDEATVAFFHAAGRDVWTDFGYTTADAARMIDDDDLVRTASLDQVRTMLTYCVRGERFCDGHWAAMIESGNVCRLLERLSILYEQLRHLEGA